MSRKFFKRLVFVRNLADSKCLPFSFYFVFLIQFDNVDLGFTYGPNTQELSGEPKALEVKKAKGITQSNNQTELR